VTRADGTRIGAATIAAAVARMAERSRAAGHDAPESQQISPETAARMREQQRLMSYQLAEARKER
jgi:hypothetical protein